MTHRLPEPPPVLAGYTYLRPLGSGGFADVSLYEQSMPRRTVAVKVLLSSIADPGIQEMFAAEVTMMAQLASHPSVLTVYEAGVAPDGRPYLVMEHCPSTYGSRLRRERIPLAEALQVATGVGSALETAHRSGILHRDVKPSNIFRTRYGRPVLGDFGIASAIGRSAGGDVRALSVAWSAPEVLTGASAGSVRTEVWAFCASVYGLLAGRSPFEVPGEENTRREVERRILSRTPARPIGRADVPPRVERALLAGLAKNPAQRPDSILDILQEVQLAEADEGFRPSRLEIAEERVGAEWPAPSPPPGARDDAHSRRSRAPLRASRPGAAATRRGRPGLRTPALAFAAAVVVAGGVAGAAAVVQTGEGIPRVAAPSVSQTARSATFRWEDPGARPGDRFVVRVDGVANPPQARRWFVVERATDVRVCVTVSVDRQGRRGDQSDATCVGR